MATFAYRAFDRSGKRQKGTLTASSGKHARQQLRDQGLRVESVTERSGATKKLDSVSYLSTKRRYHRDVSTAMREIATLLQAGIPLVESLDSVVAQSKGGFRACVVSIRDRVSSGTNLADAMSEENGVFDQMIVGMVRVGEHTGNLDEVCEQIAEFRERSGELKDRVVSALLYPAMILAVSLAVTIFLMTVVVPMLLENLVQLGRPLPTPTLILKWISDTLLNYGLYGLVSVATGIVLAAAFCSTPAGRNRVDAWAIRTPVVGDLIRKQSLSRMTLIVSTLLRSGVELVEALKIAERSSTNSVLTTALNSLRDDLEAGRDLREAASQHAIFPHSLVQILSLGQQSGQLEKMLDRVGRDYDRQAELVAGRLTTVIEPVLILLLSVLVGFILFATILPILEAGNVLAS
ncbi:MAG: type II secretion system F family protein [Planctomycetota bacterium]